MLVLTVNWNTHEGVGLIIAMVARVLALCLAVWWYLDSQPTGGERLYQSAIRFDEIRRRASASKDAEDKRILNRIADCLRGLARRNLEEVCPHSHEHTHTTTISHRHRHNEGEDHHGADE
jgi:ABC-type nickel/cobalt efflux system permease component RcnA